MAKKWIAKATEDAHGQFAAKAKAAGYSTAGYARMHEHSAGVLGKQARLALTLMKMSHSKKPSKADKMYGKG